MRVIASVSYPSMKLVYLEVCWPSWNRPSQSLSHSLSYKIKAFASLALTTPTAARSLTMRTTLNSAATEPSDISPRVFPMTPIAIKTSTLLAVMLNFLVGQDTEAEQPIPALHAVLNLDGQLNLFTVGKTT